MSNLSSLYILKWSGRVQYTLRTLKYSRNSWFLSSVVATMAFVSLFSLSLQLSCILVVVLLYKTRKQVKQTFNAVLSKSIHVRASDVSFVIAQARNADISPIPVLSRRSISYQKHPRSNFTSNLPLRMAKWSRRYSQISQWTKE